MIAAEALTKIFRSGDGVRGVSLTVQPGEIHALVGLNGAGKSTLMRLMLGMIAADAGTTRIAGTLIEAAGPELWAGVGHLVEYPLAYPELTVRQNLHLGARLHGLAGRDAAASVARVIDELNLGQYTQRRARELSLGNRQRLGLASALQHDPTTIVLDEPTNALDPSGVILLREVLSRRAREQGAAILVSSHHLDEVARVADRISVINAGRLIGTLDPGGIDIERAFFALVLADSVHTGSQGRS